MRNFASFLVLPWAIIGIVNTALAFDAPKHNTPTNTYTAELKPIPNSFQLAKTTFLPDRFEDLGLSDYDTLHGDYNIGNCDAYPLSSCPDGTRCESCPFNAKKFRALSCTLPYVMSGGTCVCPPTVSLTYANDKCVKYCGSNCIQKTCTPTANQSNCTNGTQNCDNNCGQNTRKCCIACTHKVTSKPENSSYTYSSCFDGSNKQIQTGWECDPGYHEKSDYCEKDCISNPCSGYDLTECPSGYTCESCTITATNCSTDGTFYKILECPTGQLDLNNYWCGGALQCWLK